MSREIHNSRIVCGILEELASSSTIIILKQNDAQRSVIFSKINIIITGNYSASMVEIEDESINYFEEYACEAIHEGRRVLFSLLPTNGQQFHIPKEVKVTDLRKQQRFNVPTGQYISEVRTKYSVLHGYVYDISKSSISIISESSISIDEACNCEMLVRENSDQTVIIFRSVSLIQIIKTDDFNKLIFSISVNKEKTTAKRAVRSNVADVMIPFKSVKVGNKIFQGEICISNVSLTGFKGVVASNGSNQELPLGLILESTFPMIKFFPVWSIGGGYGFKLSTFLDHEGLGQWLSFIKKYLGHGTGKIITEKELAHLLTDTTFLKSERRKIYGKNLAPFIVFAGNEMTNDVHQRLVRYSEDGYFSQNINISRFSDNSWIIHEVARDSSDPTDIVSLYNTALERLTEQKENIYGTPRHSLIIFNSAIPAINAFWSNNSKWGNDDQIFMLKHVDVSAIEDADNSTTQYIDLSDFDYNDKYRISHEFNPLFLELIDYWEPNKGNPILNRQLQKLGTGHYTIQKLIYYNQYPIGLFYKIQSYYSANVTGLLNSCFVFLSNNHNILTHNPTSIISGLKKTGILSIKDMAIIYPNVKSTEDSVLDGGKYKCICIDLGKLK